jgi:hypothetical protein
MRKIIQTTATPISAFPLFSPGTTHAQNHTGNRNTNKRVFSIFPRDDACAKSYRQPFPGLGAFLQSTKVNIKALIEFKTEIAFVLYSPVIMVLQHRINQPKALAL